MPTRNIELPDHYERFIEEQVASGRFKDADEVMRAGLQLLEQQTDEDLEKLSALRALAAQGFDELDHGLGVMLDDAAELEAHIATLGRRAASQLKQAASGE